MSVAPWYVNQAYAPTYSVGRVLCGGDAVHRHPPSSGLGSNTCVQDGFNLAWKLAYVINGHAGQDLLDSYSLERAPVGQQIVQRANQSRVDYAPLRAAFATTDTDTVTPRTRSPPGWRRSTPPPPRAPRSATPSRKRCSSRAMSSTRTGWS